MALNHYSTWAKHAQHSSLGLRLKRWVERTYVANISKALDGQPLANLRLLEIGPGEGYFADMVAPEGVAYQAVEAAPQLVERLLAKGYVVHAGRFPEALPTDSSFDVIYLSHVLEHVDTKSDALSMIVACHKALNSGGLIVINCPNVMSHKFHFWHSDYTHNFVTTPNRVYFLLSDCGFETVLESRMVFGFQNIFARWGIRLVFALMPTLILEVLARKARPNWRSSVAIYGSENFTIAARKLEQH
jgi:SAM-dependent methyltransferase